MAQRRVLHTVIAWVLAVAAVLWVSLLAGVGSELLTEPPPAVSEYAPRG